jgi:Tol biopolymer transport system component/tRNA A-37 threonylcarbamoyl transferase component Bud32
MSDLPGRLAAALADRYRIERPLGQGGMATVYLAQDLKHDRQVAIKVLKPELAAVLGADRFVQEIRTTAQLQHPHILPLFDSGSADGFLYYVMPYIEGETLRTKLDREKQLGIDEAVKITTEVADALDYAHRHGVIHRDIKPENILLHDGRPMVADFGIALAVSAAAGGRMTETGLSLGTPHYMSPEQATAEKDISARSDVYSLASVLYEMLSGQPPHLGGSAQQIIMKIIAEPVPAVTSLRKSVPANVAAALMKALEKLPADRFESAKGFAEALGNPAFSAGAAGLAAPASRSSRRNWAVFGAAFGVAMAATLIAAYLVVPRTHAGPVARFSITAPNLGISRVSFAGPVLALAPDGSRIAYVGATPGSGSTQLWVRDRADLAPRPLDGTQEADGPFFSPDSRWIGYFANGRLYKIPAAGGTPTMLTDSAPTTLAAGAWLPDDHIVFASPTFALMRVPAAGGALETVEPAPTVLSVRSYLPASMGRNDRVLITECTNNCARMTLVALDFRTHERQVLLQNTARAFYLASRILIAVRQDGSVVGTRFDPATMRITGSIVSLLAGVQQAQGINPVISVADDGTLVYQAADSAAGGTSLARVDRTGRATFMDPAWQATFTSLALSPDGRRLAVSIQFGGRSDIWVKQLDAGALTRLTFDGALNYRPAWRPDGRSLAYTSDRDSEFSYLYSLRADGSGRPERLMASDPNQVDESQFSRDGRWLIYRVGTSDGVRDIYARPVGGTDTARVTVSAGSFDEYAPTLSPDGRWIAYVSVESGHEEVYVRPFPQTDQARWQVSTAGGSGPVWANSSRELLYVSAADSLMSVPVTATPDFHAGPPTALFSTQPYLVGPFHQVFAITPDDRNFIMIPRTGSAGRGSTGPNTGNLTVVLNWFTEVNVRMRGGSQ